MFSHNHMFVFFGRNILTFKKPVTCILETLENEFLNNDMYGIGRTEVELIGLCTWKWNM